MVESVPPPVEIEVAPAYEFVLSLAVAADQAGEGTYEIQPAWSEELERSAPDLLQAVRQTSPSDMVWVHLLSLAYHTPPPREVRTFLDHLARTDPLELKLHLLGYYVRYVRRHTPPEVIARAARGDRRAQREFIVTSHPDDPQWQASLARLLSLDPQQTRDIMLPLLEAWGARVFPSLERRSLPILRRDAERVRQALRLGGVDAAVAAALPGVDYVAEPGIDRMLLIPSYSIRPQIHAFDHLTLRIYAYPVADESLSRVGDDLPSPRLIRLLKALGDERRLRVLKHLTTGSYTLQELADHFEVGSTTMLHHMVILRSAGLVRLQSARGKRYALVRPSLPQLAALLEEYLGQDAPGSDATPRA